MSYEPVQRARASSVPGAVGLALVALISLAPFFFEHHPVGFVSFQGPPATLGKNAVFLLMALAVGVRAWEDRRWERHARFVNALLFFLGGLMAYCHWIMVDTKQVAVFDGQTRHYVAYEDWQRELYLAVLNGDERKRPGLAPVPHVFRPLPYGFTRSLELATGDWNFACLTYRWFFNYWFLWAFYRFVRLFCGSGRAFLALLTLVPLYPMSIRYYGGQLTDPLSHALFALALCYVVEDRWLLLAVALALGVLAKETAMIIVPAYWACYWRREKWTLAKTAALAGACFLAFLAARLPLGWWPDFRSINSAKGLMIGTNLGFGVPLDRGLAPPWQNYLQPLLFIGVFLPFIWRNWRLTDRRLRILFLVLTPLLLASSLSFSWLYESRNYVPLLPVLTAASLARGPASARSSS
jgi:hypothetical protein